MAMTSAQRQARYRERVKARAGEGLEAAVERVRREILSEWISDAEEHASDPEGPFLRRVGARPLWHRQGFTDWLETLIAYECERDIAMARKEEKRQAGTRRQRRARHHQPDAAP